MCNCKKGKPKNSSVVTGSFTLMKNGLKNVNTDPYVVKYYIGETGQYIGSATGINYGVRVYNTKVMVHVDDLEADSHLFSDTEQIEETRGIQEEVLVDETIEPNLESVVKPKKTKKTKESEEDGESL